MDSSPIYIALRPKSRLMWLMRQVLILALALFSSLVGIWQLQPVRAAGEYIFFAETEGDYLFKRRDLPGGGNEVTIYTTQYIDKVISEVVTAVVVDPDSNKLYYAVADGNNNTSRIVQSNLDGSGAVSFRTGKVCALAIHDGKLYFAENEGDYLLKRCDLPGGGNEITIYTTQYNPGVISEAVTAIAVNPATDKLYYAVADGNDNTSRIVQSDLDGSSAVSFRTGKVCALAIHDGKLYFAEDEGDYLLKRCDLPGGGNEITIYATQYNPGVISEVVTAIAVDPTTDKLYYAVNDGMNNTSRIAQSNLDGSNAVNFRAGRVNSLAIPGEASTTPTTTSVTSSPNPSVYGQSVTFTATVTGAGGTPTGNVTFYDNGVSLGSQALSGGVAITSTSSLIAATHSITATYSGDSTFAASTSTTHSHVVNKAATTTSLNSSPNPSVFGQSVTFTSTVTSSNGTPTGVVTFTVDSTPHTATLSSGVATYSTAALSVGSHNVAAEYGGAANYVGSVATPISQTVNQAGTTTTLISDPNPSMLGKNVVFTTTVAAVAPGAGIPAGAVTLYRDGATQATGALNSSGVMTYATNSLIVATHEFTASYSGNASFLPSISATYPQTVSKALSYTTLASGPNPSSYGQSVGFTATVTGEATVQPTGVVTFSMSGAQASATLVNGVATYFTSSLSTGVHTTTVAYVGDGNYVGSSDSAVQTVNKASTTTMLTSSENPTGLGQSVTFWAPVYGVTVTPTGQLTFTVDGAPHVATLSATGVASYTTSALATGDHIVVAAYGGDINCQSSVSEPHTQSVGCAAVITVTNTADDGAGSLRQALKDVCSGGTIRFDLPTPAIITLSTGELPITKTLTILGPGADLLTVDGNGDSRVFLVEEGVSATISNLTIRNGNASDSGGGVYSVGALTLQDCVLADNSALLMGGGVAVVSGTLTVERVLFQNNRSDYGGGVSAAGAEINLTDVIFDSNLAMSRGGGLSLDVESTTTGQRVTFIHNRAYKPEKLPRRLMDVSDGFAGGGMTLEDGALSAVFANSTWYDNTARGAGDVGGGAINVYDGALTLLNCTIVGNTVAASDTVGGGGVSVYSGTVTLTNTLVAQNISNVGQPDLAGDFVSGGHNLIGDATGSTGFASGVHGDIVGDSAAPVDPLIGSLGDWGGETETISLLPGSLAIDAADDAAAPAADQRGVTRPQGAHADIGAYESRGFTMTVAGGDNQTAIVGRDFAQPLSVTVSSAYAEPVNGGVVTFSGPEMDAGLSSSPLTATIAGGCAGVTATANYITGAYSVTASLAGAQPISYTLENILPPMYVDGALGTNDASHGLGPGADAFRTIQYAVDQAPGGGTIYIAANTYHERIIINKELTLVGGAEDDVFDSQPIIDGDLVTLAGSAPAGAKAYDAVITARVYGVKLRGLTLQNADAAVLLMSGSDLPRDGKGLWARINFCNLISATWGVSNTTNVATDATHNWWGDSSGPSGEGSGTGAGVSADVSYDPWIGASLEGSKTETLDAGTVELDARDEAGIWAEKMGDGAPALTCAKYADNPQSDFAAAAGQYYDVNLSDDYDVEQLTLRFYFTQDEIAGLFGQTLAIRYWNGAQWVACSDQTLHLGAVTVNGVTYVGYIEVLITATTTPSLADLTGTEFALEGERVFPPESLSMSLAAGPEPFCPGWTLFYTFRLTNTQAVTLTNLTATNDLPVNTCCAANEPGSQAMGSYNEATNRMTWSLGPLPPGQTLELRWSLHSFTSIVSGSTLTNTLVFSATELTEPGTLAVGLTADDSICAVTPTPTSTPTPITPTPTVTIYPSPSPTPTLTPTSRGPLYLPLVFNMGGNN